MNSQDRSECGLVLVVDDEESVADMLCQLLVYSGFEAIAAYSGEQGLMLMERRLPDAVVLDIRMPVLDGWEVCRRLRSNPLTKDIPVLMYTSLSNTDDVRRSRDSGADSHIVKDREPMVIIKAVGDLIHASRKHSDRRR